MQKRNWMWLGVTSVVLMSGSGAWAQKGGAKKPPAKPAAKAKVKPAPKKKPATAGTNPMRGEYGEPGVAYTVGKDSALNYTLRSIEYSVTPVTIDRRASIAGAQKKLVRADFTVQNPLPRPVTIYHQTQNISLVSTTSETYLARDMGQNNTTKSLGNELKPGQKLDFYAVFIVPADAVIDRLIVMHHPTMPVVRYRVQPFIKKLPKFYSEDGIRPREVMAGEPGTFYPAGMVAVRFDGWEETPTLDGREPYKGQKFIAANFTVKNITDTDHTPYYMVARLRDDNSGELRATRIAQPKRDEEKYPTLKFNKEWKARAIFTVPVDHDYTHLQLGDHYDGDSRIYEFPIAR